MSVLNEFANYIRKNRQDEVLDKIMEIYHLPDHSILSSQPISINLLHFLKDKLSILLNILEDKNVPSAIENQWDIWFNKSEIEERQKLHEAKLLFSFIYFSKTALVDFIPGFTTDVITAVKIVSDLENVHKQFQNKRYKTFENSSAVMKIELEESEERYKDLFDNAHDLIHFVAPVGKIMYVNKAWQKTLDYSIDEIIGNSIYNFIEDDCLEEFTKYREKILNQYNDEDHIQVSLKKKNGTAVIAEGFVSAKFIAGKAAYTRGIFRDITLRIENEKKLLRINEQLSEREENLLQLVTYAPDAIVAINEQSFITFWNPKAEEVFGWSGSEVMNKPLAEVIIPLIYREAHTKGMNRYLATGEAHVLNKTIEITALNKKGEEFYISLTISKSRQRGEIGFIAFIRDMTIQKKNLLELEQKRKELEASNKELEQYAWLTSHDLREPLRKILTYSDILLTIHKEILPEVVEKNVQKIYQSGKRMGSLVQAILMYSDLSSEQHLFEQVDLNLIIKEVLVDLELLISDAQAFIQVDELITIEAIPLQMRQLFLNLIGNSIKYRQKHIAPYIKISAEEKNGYLEMVLKDNGIGFETKDKDKIFKLFQRFSSHKTEGTGIGLALCKKIVEKHNGFINVESQTGVGSSFFISLPIHKALV